MFNLAAISFLIIAAQVAFFVALGGVGLATYSRVRKYMIKNKTLKLGEKLAKATSKKTRNLSRERRILKRYEKSRLKAARHGILLGTERGLDKTTFRSKKLPNNLAKYEIADARLNLEKLKGKHPKKIATLEEQKNKHKESLKRDFTKMSDVGGLDIESPAKSILIGDSKYIADRFNIAVNSDLSNQYKDFRGGIKASNPIVTDVYDSDNKQIRHLSDTSPTRSEEFSALMFADLYRKAQENEANGLPVSYRAVTFDTYRDGDATDIVETTLTSSAQIREHYLKKVLPFHVKVSDSVKFKTKYFSKKASYETRFDDFVKTLRYIEKSSRYVKDNLRTTSPKLASEFKSDIDSSIKYPSTASRPIYTRFVDKLAKSEEASNIVSLATKSELKRTDYLKKMFADAYGIALQKETDGQKIEFVLETIRYDESKHIVDRRPADQAMFTSAEQIKKYAVEKFGYDETKFKDMSDEYNKSRTVLESEHTA